jgi:hypothetical protein
LFALLGTALRDGVDLPLTVVQTMPEQSENKATNTDKIDKTKQPPTTKPAEGELSEQELEKASGGGWNIGKGPKV